MKASHPSRSAFSLIELLVTVAIIALLASLLLPALSKASASAKTAKCRNNLKQILLAQAQYVSDYSAFPPMGSIEYHWWNSFAAYGIKGSRDPNRNTIVLQPGGLGCPTAKYDLVLLRSGAYIIDYGYNWSGLEWSDLGLGGSTRVELNETGPFLLISPTRESRVLAPAEMIAYGDNFMRLSIRQRILDVGTGLSGYGNGSDGYSMRGRNGLSLARQRHGGRLNTGFCDGHIETLKLDQVYFDNTVPARRRWHTDNEPHLELALNK